MSLVLYLIYRTYPYQLCAGWFLDSKFNINWTTRSVHKQRMLKRQSLIEDNIILYFGYRKVTHAVFALEVLFIGLLFFKGISLLYVGFCALGAFMYPDIKLYEKDKQLRHGLNQSLPPMLMSVKLLILAGMPTVKVMNMVNGEDELSHILRHTLIQIEKGKSVTKAYIKLSNQAQLTSITRLSRIMIQDEKHGSNETIILLDKLLEDIRKERRTQILKKAEEASTKMLLPMMIALFGVLIAVTVPALSQLFSSF